MGRKKKRLGTESVEMKDLEMKGLGTKAWGRLIYDILKRRLTNYRS